MWISIIFFKAFGQLSWHVHDQLVITSYFSVDIDAKLIVRCQWKTLSDTDDFMNPGVKVPLLKPETSVNSTVEIDLNRDDKSRSKHLIFEYIH